MSRPVTLLLAAALALACQKKDSGVVVAAPITPSGATAGAQAQSGQAGDLPPGHPPIGQMDGQQQGQSGDAGGMGAMGDTGAPPHGGAAMSAEGDVGDVKVAKATGKDARTIAEVFADRKALAGKTVAVRGKVVKYNPGIMGKNWLHLRDGTGAAGTNDVTVTTQDATARGDVVTVRGTVAVDQDIGMGTPYPVIIQDAKVTK